MKTALVVAPHPDDAEHAHRAKVLGDAEKKLGGRKVRRTMWDSHHAALDTLDYAQEHIGEIKIEKEHSPLWTGPDVTGHAAKKLTGVNTAADVIFHVRSHRTGKKESVGFDAGNNGFLGASIKYSGDHLKRNQKIRQNGMKSQIDIIQAAHRAIHGHDDHELSAAHAAFSAHPDDAEHNALAPHAHFLHHMFGLNASGSSLVGHPGKKTKAGALKSAKYTEENGNRKLNDVAGSYLREVQRGNIKRDNIPHPTENRMMTNQEVKDHATATLASQANARPDPSKIRDAMVNSINKTIHGKSEGSKARGTDNPNTRSRAGHSLVRKLVNANQPESAASKAQHVLFVSINSGRKKDREAMSRRIKPVTHIGSLDKALSRHRKQNNHLPLSQSLVAQAGDGGGGFTIGPKNGKALLSVALDHRSGGSWVHQMSPDHLFPGQGH